MILVAEIFAGLLVLVGCGILVSAVARPGLGDPGGKLEDFPKSREREDDTRW